MIFETKSAIEQKQIDSKPVDFVLKKDENYYPQVFLKECKYIEKIIIYITDDLQLSSGYPDEYNEEWGLFLKKQKIFKREKYRILGIYTKNMFAINISYHILEDYSFTYHVCNKYISLYISIIIVLLRTSGTLD